MAESDSSSEMRPQRGKQRSKRLSEKYAGNISDFMEQKAYTVGTAFSTKLSRDRDRDTTTHTVLSLTDLRREKNKESAKNTRKRKKIYTDLLENKIKELIVELGFVKEQVKLAKINQSHDALMKVIYGFKNLSDKKDVNPEETAKERLEHLRSNMMEIPERKQLIKSHIEQFVEQSQTPFSRYFCSTALSNTGFFCPIEQELTGPAQSLNETLTLNNAQVNELKALQPDLVEVGSKFKVYNQELAEISQEIYSLSDTMDSLVEKLVNYLAFQTIENFYSYFRQIKATPNIERLLLEGAGLQQLATDGSKEDNSLSFFDDITLGKRKPLPDDN